MKKEEWRDHKSGRKVTAEGRSRGQDNKSSYDAEHRRNEEIGVLGSPGPDAYPVRTHQETSLKKLLFFPQRYTPS